MSNFTPSYLFTQDKDDKKYSEMNGRKYFVEFNIP